MISEIRLYYESVEQTSHYVLPIIQKTVKSLARNIPINLVKLYRNYAYYSKNVAPVIYWKEPDILITAIHNGVEYPLLIVEFSTAVFTEDHELQRFDGLLAAAINNCVYIKISPTEKKSPTGHGGKIEFDYTEPFSLIYAKYNKPYFHFEWECDEKGIVKVNPEYLSCPEKINEFEKLLEVIVKEILEHGYSKNWIDKVVASLQSEHYFMEWLNKLSSTRIDITTLDSSRTRWVKKDTVLNSEVLELKLNRFGHAMDPERGMLAYYGTLTTNTVSKMVFDKDKDAWYKDIPKEEEIRQHIQQSGLAKACDFLYCFALGSGLHGNKEFMEIVKSHERNKADYIKIDLTEFIKNNFSELNKALRTIFTYSALFAIEDTHGRRRVVFTWQPYQDSGVFENYPDVIPIKERKTLDEDDVTYITVHNILKPNGFRIIAVSYPGAQGDRRILVEPGTGRRQPREYIDVISFLPAKVTNLQENKGKYSPKEAQSDIGELSRYKKEQEFIEGLRDFQERYAPDSLNTVIKIGVGFWASRTFKIAHVAKLNLNDLDYFVYITSDRKKWNIWSRSDENIFHITGGKVLIPDTYEVYGTFSQNVPKTVKLSNFMVRT